MAKGIDQKIPDLNTSWEGYLGSRVEEFVKEFLQNLDTQKHGAWSFTSEDDGLVTLRAFKDDEAKEAYEKDPERNATLKLAEISFKTGGVEGYTLATRVTKSPETDMVKGASNIVKFIYNCYYGGDANDLDTEDGTAKVFINNTEIPELALTVKPGNNEYTIDLGPYLTQETNTVQIVVSNKHGNSRSFNFTIRSLEIILSLDESYQESLLREGAWNLRVACRGISAQVHVSVDGKEIAQSTITNSTNDFIIDSDGSLTPGSHRIDIYAENSSFAIKTSTITTYFIKKGLSTPSICVGTKADSKVTLYGTASIPYYLYYPNAGGQQVTVNFEIRNTAGIKQADLTSQTVTLLADGTSGMQELRATIDKNEYLALGEIDIVLKVGSASATHRLSVESAGVELEAASECKIYLSAAGRTNADSDAEDWHSEYNGQRTCTVKRSDNFKLTEGNGFVGDAFVIKAGKSITLDGFYPFGQDFGVNATNAANRTGRTIEFELKAANCTNSNTKIIECLNGGVGFVIYANRIELYSSEGGNVETIYSDEQKIRVGFCIDGNTTHCVNQLIDSTEESDCNIAYVYLNGVMVRMMDYKTSKWQQGTPQKIVIGSNDCDVELYTVRIYDKSLNYQQMLGNYAFDTPDVAEKIAIAKRNDVLDSANAVDFAKTLIALPNTPYKIWEIDKMPTGKKDWQKCSTEFVNPAWENNPGAVPAPFASFTCRNHDIALDGTSSLSYPDPYKNWADKYNGTWTVRIDGVDVTITGYSITNGVDMKAKEFVDKVNFASSEGIFNILVANAFQNILIGAANQYPALLTDTQAAQQAQGKPINYRQSLSGFPIIGFLRTNQGGQNIIRFLSIYNFINNKYDPYYFGYDNDGKYELWEVEDNVNFFSEYMEEGKWVNGEWQDQATTLYYARVPKTSPTTGQDYGVAGNAQGVAQANKESSKLRRFHNWVYSCNPNIAERYRLVNGTYQQLPSQVTYGSTTYTHDTPEYRVAKFNEEYADYIDKPSALFYFVMFSWVLGVDSFDKNMTIGFKENSAGKTIAYFVQRDSDTGFMYGNRGTLLFKVFHEWGDSYDESTGETGIVEGEEYNASNGTFSVKCSVGSPVFNGRLSGLWDCVSKAWGEDIKAMYQAMRSNGLNQQGMWQLFNSFWSQWCEALYNADGMGYANTGRFDMAHGDKREVMRYYCKFRQRYWDSKCGANTSQALELRLWGNGAGVALRHSIPLYASLNWGAGGIQTIRSLTPGKPVYFPSTGANFNETTFTVYDADLLTEISTYQDMPDGSKVESGLQGIATSLDVTGLEYCRKLERLILDFSGKAANTNLSSRVTNIGNSIALRELVVRNCPNVSGAFNLQSEKIEIVDLRDTGATALTLPPTDSLRSVQLGSAIRSINLASYPNLSTLTLQGYDQLTALQIEECPNIDTQTLVENILWEGNGSLQTLKLRGIDWTGFRAEHLEKILAMQEADLTGRIRMGNRENVTFDLKTKLIEKWGDIDSATNPLYITYDIHELTAFMIKGERYLGETGNYQFTMIPSNATANNFKKVKWEISSTAYATINETTGVLTVNRIGSESQKPTARITATVTLNDGSQISNSTEVGFYKRSCQLGDLVFADGTFSDVDNGTKTVVGICFYINPNDPTQRLCVAPTDMPSYAWGLYSGNIPGITLNDNPGYSVYDIPTMANRGTVGIPSNYLTDENLRDSTTADGFKVLAKDTAVGEFGFEQLLSSLGGYREESILPWGLINTLRIVQHRDMILTDSAVNLLRPSASGNISILQSLYNLMSKVVEENGNNTAYNQYYYPAASQCNCYEPSVPAGEKLADCFKQGKWYLPSCGELSRLYWYHSKGYVEGAANAIFANAVTQGKMTRFNNTNYWSSTEVNATSAWYVNFSNGSVSVNNKSNSNAVRAVAAF